jgi:hypothetical protein
MRAARLFASMQPVHASFLGWPDHKEAGSAFPAMLVTRIFAPIPACAPFRYMVRVTEFSPFKQALFNQFKGIAAGWFH